MNKKSNFFEKISQIIDYYGIKNVTSFAKDYLNYTSSEKINRLKDNNKHPSYEILVDISNKFEEIDANWLLTGRGKMLKNDNETLMPSESTNNKELLDMIERLVRENERFKMEIEVLKNGDVGLVTEDVNVA